MSGGGRCNFTNLDISPDKFISHNPHFCKSALSRYTQWNFIELVNSYAVPWHERDLGKLFCDDSAKDILDILLAECRKVQVDIRLDCLISDVDHNGENGFTLQTSVGCLRAAALVVASGGLSIPKMCASPIGYNIAAQFSHHVWPTSAGLVPFTLQPDDKARFAELAGISVHVCVSNSRVQFNENILFTHRGLSGPAILQISSYWLPGEVITLDLLAQVEIADILKTRHSLQPQQKLKTLLHELLPKRLVTALFDEAILEKPLQEFSQTRINEISTQLTQWQLRPNGTEGYRTAEVTLGGVDCDELSSRTMESKKVAGLYFIGEVVDVSGWLGGYNFQWAWSSGWCAGQVV
jgi:predicted Rossmann fold flavoprotein